MTVTEFLFQLTLLVISFAVPVATTFVVKYLQTKAGNENLKKYISYAETAVKAAETIYNSRGQGVIKKADVEKYLSAKIGNVLSPEDIDKLIQAAVFEIQKASGKLLDIDYSPLVPPTITTTSPTITPPFTFTSNTTANVKAAPDIPSPVVTTQTYADAVTQDEYKKAVEELNTQTSGDSIDPTTY